MLFSPILKRKNYKIHLYKMNTKISSRYFLFLILFSAFLFFGVLMYWLELSKEETSNQIFYSGDKLPSLTIMLSPHFDDAALSLGGLMAKNRRGKLFVATFFAGKPAEPMTTEWDRKSGFSDSDEAVPAREKENEAALAPFGAIIKNYDYLDYQYRGTRYDRAIEESIVRDIESIISIYGAGRQILMYGPAVFNQEITHPDHRILHDAFLEVSRRHRQESNIKFFIYEDFPYVRQFENKGFGNLGDFLKEKYEEEFEEISIELTEAQISKKVIAISDYASQVLAIGNNIAALAEGFSVNRCKTNFPLWHGCEIVYRIKI